MAQYRLVHVGAAVLLTAAVMTTVSVAQSVFAGANSASSFVPTVPCRLVDTRASSAVGGRTTPIGAGETVTFSVSGTNGECTIPSSATAISTNVTIDNPTAASFLTVVPGDSNLNHTSNLNWQASSAPVANQVTVGLSPTGAIKVFNNAGSVDVIIDISGYYEPTAVAQGTQGAQGEKGEKGDKGERGDKGDTGDAILATLHCTAGQTITWNATSSAWDCTDPVVNTDTLAALNCTPNQSVRWDGSAWVCRSEPIVATLSRVAFAGPACCEIQDVFQAYSPNVNPTGFCFDFECHIQLVDVLDHTSCQVSFTGNSDADQLDTEVTSFDINVRFLYRLNPAEPLYINVSCTT